MARIVDAYESAASTPKEREPTFDELATEYLERHAKRKKRRWREDERVLRIDLLPAWRERSVSTIQRRDVAEVLDRIVERGSPIMANRTKALISKIFNFGLSRDLVSHNPYLGVPMPAKARQRDRVLSEDEIRRMWHTAGRESLVMAATFKMRLLTAQRAGEVLAMRWDEIDGDTWTIPAERSKNGYAHVVPLSSAARRLLAQLEPVTGDSPWVFESPKVPSTHIVSIQKAAYRIADRSGVSFVPHDLRRTAATSIASMGEPRLVIAKILNHVDRSVTAIYERHRYDAEKGDALERWGQRVEAIVHAETALGP